MSKPIVATTFRRNAGGGHARVAHMLGLRLGSAACALLSICLPTPPARANDSAAGKPSFYARREYAAGCGYGGSQLVATADANQDGYPDLICSSGPRVLLGNGDGTFRDAPPSNTRGGFAVAAADVNNDGRIDLIFSGASPQDNGPFGVGVSLGNGDGTFQPQVFYQAASDRNFNSVAVGDFNGDQLLDIATQGESGVWIFFGNGGGLFAPGQLVTLGQPGGGLYAFNVADFNGDGKLDLVAWQPRGFAVLLGRGDGTFLPEVDTMSQFRRSFSGLSVGDLNGDGRPDVVLVNLLYDYVLVYRGNGDGTFAAPTRVYLPGNLNIDIGDVNGDGIPDLISNGVYIAVGRGDGTFKAPVYYAVASAPTTGGAVDVMVADLRNTGRLDIVTVNFYSSLSVLLNGGGGHYIEGVWSPLAGGGAGCAASTDFDHDGKPDLAVTVDQGVSLLLGTGQAGRPFRQGAIVPVTNPGCVVAGDLNGDGIPDFIVLSGAGTGEVLAFLGNGDGTFIQNSVNPVPALGWPALADVNGDGKLDFLLSSNLLALGNGDGTFQPAAPFVPDVLPPTQLTGFTDIAAGDLNGDGRADVLLTDYMHDYLYILISDGAGGFRQTVQMTSGVCTYADTPVIGDIDKNGTPDVVFGCVDGRTPIYLNDGQGNLTYRKSLKENVVSDGMLPVIGDLNGDGIPDLAVLTNYDVAVYFGKGGLNFTDPIYLGTGTQAAWILLMNAHGQPATAGKPDIVIPDGSGQILTLLNMTR